MRKKLVCVCETHHVPEFHLNTQTTTLDKTDKVLAPHEAHNLIIDSKQTYT